MKNYRGLLLLVSCVCFFQASCFSMNANYHWVDINVAVEKLLEASAEGDLDLVRQLVGRGISVNISNEVGNTPLMLAACNGNEDIVLFLLTYQQEQAQVNAQSKMGMTALCYAVYGGYTKIVRILLNAGAQVNIKAHGGNTALHAVVQFDEYKDILNMLINRSPDINVQNNNRVTALQLAKYYQNNYAVAQLLAKGARE